LREPSPKSIHNNNNDSAFVAILRRVKHVMKEDADRGGKGGAKTNPQKALAKCDRCNIQILLHL
jgi:hypothetical protein